MKSKKAKTSVVGSWRRNLYDIGRKIENYRRLLKRGDKRVSLFSEKIAKLARNANYLTLKLAPFERAEQ